MLTQILPVLAARIYALAERGNQEATSWTPRPVSSQHTTPASKSERRVNNDTQLWAASTLLDPDCSTQDTTQHSTSEVPMSTLTLPMASPRSLKRTCDAAGLEDPSQEYSTTAARLKQASSVFNGAAPEMALCQPTGEAPHPTSSAPVNTPIPHSATSNSTPKPRAKKAKLTFEEQEVQRIEKEFKERQKADEKARKEEEKAKKEAEKESIERQKTQEKARKEEEKRLKDLEKEEKRKAREEQARIKMEEKKQKEEESNKKARVYTP